MRPTKRYRRERERRQSPSLSGSADARRSARAPLLRGDRRVELAGEVALVGAALEQRRPAPRAGQRVGEAQRARVLRRGFAVRAERRGARRGRRREAQHRRRVAARRRRDGRCEPDPRAGRAARRAPRWPRDAARPGGGARAPPRRPAGRAHGGRRRRRPARRRRPTPGTRPGGRARPARAPRAARPRPAASRSRSPRADGARRPRAGPPARAPRRARWAGSRPCPPRAPR